MAGEDAVLAIAGDTVTPEHRGKDHDHGKKHDDHDAHGGDPECIAEEEVVVGPVCVEIEEVISDILST